MKPASQAEWFDAVTDAWHAVNVARIALIVGADWDQLRPPHLRDRLSLALDAFANAVGMAPPI